MDENVFATEKSRGKKILRVFFLGEKPILKLFKDAACCFKSILKADHTKRQLYGHLRPISNTI